MIFNRTLNDVENSLKIREEKVKKGIELSQDDLDILEKGFLTVGTINRIEQKQQELSKKFIEIGYFNNIESKSWEFGDFFLKTDFDRIFKNNTILKDSFFVFSTTPIVVNNKVHFENLNKIEKMLYDLQEMLDDVKIRFRSCGTFNCGG